MKTADGFEQAYNAQAVVDNGSHLIVAVHVSDAVNDKQQIAPALGHASLSSTAVYTTAVGMEARTFLSRMWEGA